MVCPVVVGVELCRRRRRVGVHLYARGQPRQLLWRRPMDDVTFAQTRMLANCQLGLVALVSLVALTGTESQIRRVFQILFLTTIGAFRGVYLGMSEGSILPIFESAWATLLSIPPFLFLGYFCFVY
mmetsp:Transcript_19005/g.44527  ORF Transcript_19005/g.44527 Transcript_19005/m.44527 type:complete len:126 (-) Transcript_19005:88-465(-)